MESIDSEKLLDMEIIDEWIYHIDFPCDFEHEGETHSPRADYLIYLRDGILPRLTNPFAKRLVEIKINQYSHLL